MKSNPRRRNRTISGNRAPQVVMQIPARETAMELVAVWLQRGAYPDRLLENLSPARCAAVQALVYGAVKWRRTLQWRIERVTRRPPRRNVAALLLTAACELFVLTDSPSHAVVHEMVSLARRRLTRSEAGFVNAVLRAMLRDRAAADRLLAAAPGPLRLSHPDDLWERWTQHYGAAAAERLCLWNNMRGEMVIRPQRSDGVNTGLRERLQAAGIDAQPHPARPRECLVLPAGISPVSAPGYGEGAFSVQDPATLMAVDMLGPRPGETILDACAAPGGKTAVLADRMNARGSLVAIEKESRRIRRLKENMTRLARDEVLVLHGDITGQHVPVPTALASVAPAGFDAILIDAPCSNTGVLRRRPDARWRFRARHLQSLACAQHALLSAAAEWMKPDGRIVYSTCSVEPEENERVVADWIALHPEFKCDEAIKLFPPESQTDGAYAARLVRRRKAGQGDGVQPLHPPWSPRNSFVFKIQEAVRQARMALT